MLPCGPLRQCKQVIPPSEVIKVLRASVAGDVGKADADAASSARREVTCKNFMFAFVSNARMRSRRKCS